MIGQLILSTYAYGFVVRKYELYETYRVYWFAPRNPVIDFTEGEGDTPTGLVKDFRRALLNLHPDAQ